MIVFIISGGVRCNSEDETVLRVERFGRISFQDYADSRMNLEPKLRSYARGPTSNLSSNIAEYMQVSPAHTIDGTPLNMTLLQTWDLLRLTERKGGLPHGFISTRATLTSIVISLLSQNLIQWVDKLHGNDRPI